MAQAVPVLIPPLQLSVSEKSPVAVIEETLRVRLPVLLKRSVWEAELFPTDVEAKLRLLDAGDPKPM
jgi:hypothetical protein